MTDCKNLELAREWAEWVKDNPDVYGGTSNRDRAAKVIDRLRSKGKGSYLIAADLDAAGVLAPDLPAPTYGHVPVWESGDLEVQPIDGEVHLLWDDDTDDGRGGTTRHLTLGRSDVLAILTAAAHAQKEETNE